MAVTLKEIAEEIGVSKMTISRVLNGKTQGQVSPELTAKIKAALAKYNYQPNQSARNLRSAKQPEYQSVDDSTVTLLLPCPDFLDKPIDLIAEYVEISNAVLQTACQHDFKVKVLPISRTNDPYDIEWAWLKDLGAGSRVLAYSAWFLPVLTELSRRGCRIAMISAEVFWRQAYNNVAKDWALFTYMTVDGSMQLVQHLIKEGCRKIAIATKYPDEPDEPLVVGYNNVLKKHKNRYSNIIRLQKKNAQELDIETIRNAYDKDPFDSLVIECPSNWKFRYRDSLAKNLDLPEDIRILFCDDRSDCSRLSPPIPSIHYPRKKMGQDAVEALLADDFIPGEKFYQGELVLR